MLHRNALLASLAALGATIAGLNSSTADPDCFCKNTVISPVAISSALPAPAIWQGFYFGGNIGGAWGDIGNSHPLAFPSATSLYRSEDISGSGVMGGLQLGYNWQAPSCCFVLGIEADIGGADMGLGSRNIYIPGPGAGYANLQTHSGGGFFGDVAARAGYAFGGTLIYAKGGFAWFDPGLSVYETLVTGAGTLGYGKEGGVLTGWTAGGGFETIIDPQWTWKIEYLFADFSNVDNGCCTDGSRNFRFFGRDLAVNSVKVGFNYILNATSPQLR